MATTAVVTLVLLAAASVAVAVAPPRVSATMAVPNVTAITAATIRPTLLRAGREVVSAEGNATSAHLRKCREGERVQAWYKGNGEYYDATIQHASASGQVTVVWFNNDPWHRTVDGSQIVPPCTTADAPASPDWSPNSRPVTPVPPLQSPQAPPAAPAGGVVYFLFMLGDGLPHADLWAKFFQTASPSQFRVLVHCQNEQACRNSGLLNMQNFEIIPTTPTYYCHDLVTAMAHLLSYAMVHRPAYAGAPEKFVFLSDSTLPVKPFREVHSFLLVDSNSDFCLFPRGQWAYGNVEGRVAVMPKHHQWVVLNRPHAELFVREWKPVDADGNWNVWLKDGSWAGQAHSVPPHTLYHPPQSNTCADEWAFVATIYGALELTTGTKDLPGFGGGAISLDGAVAYTTQGRCRTFSFWTADDGPSFASLAGLVAQDPNSHMTCYPTCPAHPANFDKLGDAGLKAMRHSPFLFVRKFSPWVQVAGFEQIFLQ